MTATNEILDITKPTMIGWLFQKTGLDQAVIFALMTRVCQASAGAVTLILVARFFSPEVQGYYYTFSSLLALQAFVELGLYVVIVSLASHEWSRLRLDDSGNIVGDASALSRLASLARFITKWYAAVSLLFILGVGVAGHVFFSLPNSTNVAWQAPWWTVVALAAIQLWLMPVLSLLEGCNQVVPLNRFRLAQTLAEAFAMWLLLVLGAGLWVAAGSLAVRIMATLAFLAGKYRRFFLSLLAGSGGDRVRWREDIWPMQWRLAAQGIVNYFALSLFTPVMFHYHGPKVAGQMGMTLQIVGVIQMMALTWVQTKVPAFGVLAAKGNYTELDRLWLRASKLSFGFTVLGSALLWAGILALGKIDAALAARILEPLPVAIFLTAYGLLMISNYHAAYLRAHAREPFLVLGVVGGLLSGGLVFLCGSKFGPLGAAAAFLAVIAGFTVPVSTVIWKKRRSEWQGRH